MINSIIIILYIRYNVKKNFNLYQYKIAAFHTIKRGWKNPPLEFYFIAVATSFAMFCI